MRDFRKYSIWQLSHELTLKIYKSTERFPKDEIYGLTSQIRRASTSIPTNISEGCGREPDAEFNRFLSIALGSANEVEYLILLSSDLNYRDLSLRDDLHKSINTIKRKIYTLKQKLKSN